LAVLLPYVWFNPHLKKAAQSAWSDWFGRRDAAGSYDWSQHVDHPIADRNSASPAAVRQAKATLTGQVRTLEEVFRFDISPAWVAQRWARVSTVVSDTDLQGFRVPLVTGTDVADIAGSLTYYFDPQQRLRRITFFGTTGDDGRVVSFLSRQFNLKYEPALGTGVYFARWNAQPVSVLRVTHAPVVRSQTPHERFQVAIELNNAQAGSALSASTQQMLSQAGLIQRR